MPEIIDVSAEEGQSRRSLLLGAGGAAAAFGAGKLLLDTDRAVGHVAGDFEPLPFDIRNQVPGSESDSDQIQCYYDTINRCVLLAGDVPFGRLFGGRMSFLVPHIDARVDEVAAYGLIADPDALHSDLSELLELAGELSMAKFFGSTRRQIDNAIERALRALRGHGLPAPLPATNKAQARKRRKAVKKLRKKVGDVTLLQYFTLASTEYSGGQLGAIADAKDVSLITCGKNDRCCKTVRWVDRKKTFPLEQKCIPAQDKECYISQSPITKGLCTAVSDDCKEA